MVTLDEMSAELRAEVARVREVVARLHAELPRWGLVVWTAGNVSQRVRVHDGEDLFVIKPSGVTYDDLTAESMVVCTLDGELLDLHAALDRAHGQVGAVGAVEQDGEVELLRDARTFGDHHGAHDVALDVEAEDLLGTLLRLVGGPCELDAASLAATAGLDLRLHDDDGRVPASDQFLSAATGIFGGGGDHATEHGHSVLLEDVARLVFKQVHPACPSIGRLGGLDTEAPSPSVDLNELSRDLGPL